ncbi:MAG: RIP metalloprotease RseP [Bacteroidota bacterium]
MDGIIMTVQLLLSLSILVGVHEFGHLIAAKAFGMRVEKFSIGFPPKIWGIKIGETEYGIGAIPLGGFVKITGMIDESLDTKSLDKDPEPYEFRAKPAWQRLIVMLGGIIVNVIVGVTIFILIVFSFGDVYLDRNEAIKHGIDAGTFAESLGFQDGDKILELNGREYEEFSETYNADILLSDGDVTYTLDRGGEIINLTLTQDQTAELVDEENGAEFLSVRAPFEFNGEFSKESNAQTIQKGDRILQVGDVEVTYFQDFRALLKERANRMVDLTVMRNERPVTLTGIKVSEEGTIGAGVTTLFDPSIRTYTFAEALKEGPSRAFEVVWVNAKAIGRIFTGGLDARDSIAGPIGIARIFGGNFDWERFWRITGLLSMVLAFMNLLPIPALDGGHVVFLLTEMISGRKPSDKFLENAQKVGMVILLSLMVFIIFNDAIKAWF